MKFEVGQDVVVTDPVGTMPPEGTTAVVTHISNHDDLDHQRIHVRWPDKYKDTPTGNYYASRFSLRSPIVQALDPMLMHWATDIALSATNKDAATHNRLVLATAKINEVLTDNEILKWKNACLNARSALSVFRDKSPQYDAVVALYRVLYTAGFKTETYKDAGKQYGDALRVACWLAYDQHSERRTSIATEQPTILSIEGLTEMKAPTIVAVTSAVYITAPGIEGKNVLDLSAEQLGSAIREIENEINSLDALATKPLSVIARINELREGLAAVVKAADTAYLDRKQVK